MFTAAPDPECRRSLIAGLCFGLLISGPAVAFTPKPGAILSAVSVHPNVLLLVDPSYSPALAKGQVNAPEGFDELTSNPGYRYGVLAGSELRLPVDTASDAHRARLGTALGTGAATDGRAQSLAEAHYEASRYMRGSRHCSPSRRVTLPAPSSIAVRRTQ